VPFDHSDADRNLRTFSYWTEKLRGGQVQVTLYREDGKTILGKGLVSVYLPENAAFHRSGKER